MNEIATPSKQVTFKGIRPSATVSSLIRVCFEKMGIFTAVDALRALVETV